MAYRMSGESPGAEPALLTSPFSQSTSMDILDSYEDPSKDFLEDVLPEASAYGDALDNASFHVNIAAHSSLLMEAFQKDSEDQYLDYGFVNPNEALQPPFCRGDNFNNLEQLANLSLEDVESVLQFDQESSNFQPPSRDCSASLQDELDNRCGLSSIHRTSHEPVGLQNIYTGGPGLYASSPLASTTNPYQQELLETPTSGVNGPFPNHHSYYSYDQLLPETTDQLNTGGLGVQASTYRSHEALFANNSLNDFQQSEPSQPYKSSPEPDSLSNGASGNPSSSEFVHSRRGYKHRHQRIYGLSEEDQKRRNQDLNNEASQLYRRRKIATMKELETQQRQEEERQEKLTKKYQNLYKQIEIYKRALNYMVNTAPLKGQSIYQS
ncbi:uncharacterized protein [Palaemon carinicauda]|uniref:uncharacterized protein n=1 Tax=Palaemon carinicauda TaxID=392227 RepID=UPI0035B67AAC